ncbi:VOC family protein [Paenibacillus alvei]
MSTIQKITANLWFNTEAEDAVRHYTSIFNNSSIGKITRYGKQRQIISGISEGDVMTISFTIEGQEFVALNGGSTYKFTEAISFIVHCATQEELDYYWTKLSKGGDEKAQVCGWLKDRFGVSWQIVPVSLNDMIADPDPDKSQRVMNAVMKMKKIDLSVLEDAYTQ